MVELFAQLIKKVGLESALVLMIVVSLGFGCYLLVNWVMKESSKRMEESLHRENVSLQRESTYLDMIKEQTEALNQHTIQAKEFHNEVKNAHEFQRKEHETFMRYQEKQMEVLQNLVISSEGIKDAVARINGYKHD